MANYHSLKNAGLAKPAASTDLGSSSNKYGNLFLDGNITLGSTVVNSNNVINPKISSISYIGDDTATSTAGGQTVTLNGTGFSTGAGVLINTVSAPSVTVVSSVQITFTAPAMSAGTYVLYVINPDGGTATYLSGISFSGTPTWTTSAGSLGSVGAGLSGSFSVAATGDATITYAVKAGSTLPSGLSLNTSTGAITGTGPSVGNTTTYNFTLTATDGQNQDTDRTFSITVVTALSSVEMLVVAGGGGTPTRGGNNVGSGGGGAGGVVVHPSRAITTGVEYTVTVGAGATVGTSQTGNSGSDSIFGSNVIVAKGGGGGGSYVVGGSGGSGGGGGYDSLAGGTATQNTLGTNGGGTGYGNNGGAASGYGTGTAGGGGAGAVGGGNTSTADGASGGIGIQWPSGSGTYYAGGGGGGGAYGGGAGTGGSGGLGGGGNGGNKGSGDPASQPGTDGTVNTGGGAGASSGGSSVAGKAGGSGVVIIRYSDTFSAAAATTGSPTITVSGGYRTYKFTSSGSITF